MKKVPKKNTIQRHDHHQILQGTETPYFYEISGSSKYDIYTYVAFGFIPPFWVNTNLLH